MAQYIAFNPEVEVNGATVLSFVESMENGRDTRMGILNKHGINPEPGQWYPQQAWLDAFREVEENIGETNLFMIGKAIVDHAEFPFMEGLEQALSAIDVAYHMNHRLHGEIMYNPDTEEMTPGIGHYELRRFDSDSRIAVMVCNNPYPSRFDEGIIAQVARRFKPAFKNPHVERDDLAESRSRGGESCTYVIQW
jgi:hypothetical protein